MFKYRITITLFLHSKRASIGYNGKDKSSNINYFNYLKYMDHGTFKSYSITPEDESIPFIQRPYSYVGHKVRADEIKVFRFALFDKLLSTEEPLVKH